MRIQCEPLYCSDGLFKGFLAIQTDIDSEKKQQSRLEHSLKLNEAILETLHDAVVTTDIRGQIKTVNPSLEQMFGYPKSALIGESISKLMPAEEAREHGEYMRKYAASKERSSSEIMGNLRSVMAQKADGTVFPLRIAVTETTVNSEPLLVAAIHDITDSEEAKTNLERFRQTLDSTLDCVFMFDSESFQFIYANRGAIDQLGFSEDELLTMHPYDIKPEFNSFQKFKRLVEPLKQRSISQLKFQTKHQRKNGEQLPVEVSLQYVALDGDLPRFVAVVRDITEQQFHEETIERLAYFDPLTDLPNRRRVREEIKTELSENASNDVYGAILLTDLDEFKSVNDTLGHRSGDRLLVELARRYQQVVADRDTVARLGGDEFLVVLKDLHSDMTIAANKAKGIAEKLLDASSKPTQTLGTAKQVSTSVGIVLYKDLPYSVSDLMRMADIAMYDAKRKGRNCYSVFDDTMQQTLLGEERLVSDLKRALSCEDQLLPWFQPKVDQYGAFSGFEALLRWHHPEKGFLTPGQFIDLAESKNLIVPLGDLVLEKSCRQMKIWREQFPIADWTVAVNISQKQLAMQDFPEKVKNTLLKTGLPAHALKLEVTESVIAENIAESIKQMEQLRAIGVTFSLDDFGTGYSSLSYLRQLPIDELKIDRSFVDSLLQDEQGFSIVESILKLSYSLNLAVVAEGIEDMDQWHTLRGLGCRSFQGYYFSKPKSSDEITEALHQICSV